MEPLYVILGIIAVLAIILIGIYNNLVAKRQVCNQAFADVDVQLKQRHNLIPNLVETVKGYASHERETLDDVIKARQAAVSADGVQDTAQAEGILTASLGKLFALAEAYPDLKANENFKELQEELSRIEDKLAAARRFFNSAVAEFNTSLQQFPAALFARSFGFTERDFFDLGVDGREALSTVPKVEF